MAPPAPSERNVARTLLLASAWSVALGIALELAVVAIFALGGRESGVPAIVADLAGKVSWATLVCGGLAVGGSLARGQPMAGAIVGVLLAPAAFVIARAVHKGACQTLAVAAPGAGAISPLALALLKSAQYALFGWFVFQNVWRRNGTVARSAWIGFVFGAAFAAIVVTWTRFVAPQTSWIDLSARAANEILFPIGCALVIHTGARAASALRS